MVAISKHQSVNNRQVGHHVQPRVITKHMQWVSTHKNQAQSYDLNQSMAALTENKHITRTHSMPVMSDRFVNSTS